ncbi:hypothetical protein ABT369_14060 [Dactylosporangium sp. NPDC000244]|uniref:hypothetical protein n=1 Tax=Dactylosporangium sp. NPDC000244 TaxID=3154365 RepID=UPI00332707CB
MQLDGEALAALRIELAAARDSIARIEAILAIGAPEAEQAAATAGEFEISPPEKFEEFQYRWPNGTVKYLDAQRYQVHHDDSDLFFVIGEEEGGRPSYQREDRGRVVVFIRSGRKESTYYPLVEFAETDRDPELYAAIVPKPSAPRSGTTTDDLDELRKVPHLESAQLERADQVFTSLRNAPSLRLLARRKDVQLMIEHAWWVGGIRGTGV